jgi:hypothetical protein
VLQTLNAEDVWHPALGQAAQLLAAAGQVGKDPGHLGRTQQLHQRIFSQVLK